MTEKKPLIIGMAAMDMNNVIGIDGKLPWHLPDDLQQFKQATMGHAFIMGRKTAESIGQPLPGRLNVILTRDIHYQAPGCEVYTDLAEAIEALSHRFEKIFIVGGGEIYEQALPLCDELILTYVWTEAPGAVRTFFPRINFDEWRLIAELPHEADEKHRYAFTIIHFSRIAPPAA